VTNPPFRARRLAPAILLAPLLLALTACGAPTAQSKLTATQAALDPPELWRVESLDDAGRVTGATLVCADQSMRDGFARADAEVWGRPCLPHRDAVDRPHLYAVRCEIDGRRFGLTLNRSGDLRTDFQAAFALTALDGSGATARQVRRFRREGACPANWIIGDQAKPDGRRGMNALAGTWGGGT
jgi:hypothetical protein